MMAVLGNLRDRILDPRNLLIWLLSSLVAGYMGPFGSFLTFGLLERFVFWGIVVGAGLFLVALWMSIEDAYLSELSYRNTEWLRLAVAPPLIMAALYPGIALYFGAEPVPLSFLQAVLAVYLLGAIITAARLAIFHEVTVTEQVTELPSGPRLMQRLPDESGPILRLSGKDHFVQVVTPNDTHEIRMRLCDAVGEMEGVDGFYTHRSHWVAKEAIREVTRDGGRHYVVSTDEELIPLSRTNLSKLQEAGLADRN